MEFDLVIRGGTIVDGTGAPRRRGDVGIRGGRITALGEVRGDAQRCSTRRPHRRARLRRHPHALRRAGVLGPRCSRISPWHGVTTVVMGNCGFGVAPTRPDASRADPRARSRTSRACSSPRSAPACGATGPSRPSPSTSTPSSAAARAHQRRGCSWATRRSASTCMGDEATEREATADEIAAHARPSSPRRWRAGADRLRHVASRRRTSATRAGRCRAAPRQLAEIEALAGCLGEAGRGVDRRRRRVPGSSSTSSQRSRRARRPVTWTALLAGMLGQGGHRGVLDDVRAAAQGVEVYPQVSCRPLVIEFQFKAPFPFESMAIFEPDERRGLRRGSGRIYADPRLPRGVPRRNGAAAPAGSWGARSISECDVRPELEERTCRTSAAERGDAPRRPRARPRARDRTSRRASAWPSRTTTTKPIVAELLAAPGAVLGLSDAGAHASQLCDAELRDPSARALGARRRRCSARAGGAPPHDTPRRGVRNRRPRASRSRRAADVAVFDPDAVGTSPVRRVHDLPAGADRLIAEAHGIRAVVVNGVVLREDGADRLDPEGPLPGQLLRSGASA